MRSERNLRIQYVDPRRRIAEFFEYTSCPDADMPGTIS